MITIARIEPGSPADAAGLRKGDCIRSVNGSPVADEFEFSFYSAEDDPELVVVRDGTDTAVTVERDAEEPLGIEPEQVPYRSCGNRCMFCFVDQLPRGMRKPLYFKDEDYRLSFLYGNYITCSNLPDTRIDRIIDMGMSPLYVSVHATDTAVRNRLLGVKKARPVLDVLARLTAGGIQVHTQVVVCPGINDKAVLDRAINDLAALYPGVASCAVIPVGLTRHRHGLPQLRPVTGRDAWNILKAVNGHQRRFGRSIGTRFVFAADEFYLRAGTAVPDGRAYEEYAQLENGVGMVRRLLDGLRKGRARLQRSKRGGHVLLVTGQSMGPLLRTELAGIRGRIRLRIVPVRNRLLGDGVTVSGLLSGSDIASCVTGKRMRADVMVLPPNCLNGDGVLLDGMTPAELAQRTGIAVHPGTYDLAGSVLDALKAPRFSG